MWWLPLLGLFDWALLVVVLPTKGRGNALRISSAFYVALATLLAVVIALISWTDGPTLARVLLGIGTAFLLYLGVREWGAETERTNTRIDDGFRQIHDPFRVDVKMRARRVAGKLLSDYAIVEIMRRMVEEFGPDRFHEQWYAADVNLAKSFQNHYADVIQLFEEFPLCQVAVDPAIKKTASDFYLKTEGIKEVATYLTDLANLL